MIYRKTWIGKTRRQKESFRGRDFARGKFEGWFLFGVLPIYINRYEREWF